MEQNATDFGILDGVRDLVGVCSDHPGEHDLATWMRLVGEVSDAMTALAAARDQAIVRLAAIDEHVDEDGVVSEQVNGLGTVSVDAGSLVAVATNSTTTFAEDLVEQAVTRVVRVPVLHEAMTEGTLDDYKSRCIATELTDVPIDLARTVVDVLEEDMGAKTGPALRRRTQAILDRLSPDLLRKRLKEARKDLGLERWAGEPGTERWAGSFPSEEAALAWAAIDTLARTLKKDGVCDTLKQARGKALTQIITGRADVKAVLSLTLPADVVEGKVDVVDGKDERVGDGASADAAPSDDVPTQPAAAEPPAVAGPVAADPAAAEGPSPQRASRTSPEALSGAATARRRSRAQRVPADAPSTEAARPTGSAKPVESPSPTGSPNPTGPATSTGAASPTHASRPTGSPSPAGSTSPTGSAVAPKPARALGSPSPHAATADRAHRPSTPPPDQTTGVGAEVAGEVFAAVTGALSTGISWLRLAAVTSSATSSATASGSGSGSGSGSDGVSTGTQHVPDAHATLFAHPETGALLDLTNELATTAYRPGRPMIQHIRQRDGRCRFPGCSTPARSCDIDHVVPWPRGQTEATNLMCLCRRHHRVKQRHRWRVRLVSDGRVRWVDPSGTEHTTYPVDHLGARELRSIRVVQHDETAQHDLAAQHDATGPDADAPPQHDATDEQHAAAPNPNGAETDAADEHDAADQPAAAGQVEVPRLIDRLDLASLDPSATETFHTIVMEHAILKDHRHPRAAVRSRGAILVDFVYKPTRPEGCGPPPRFVLSRRLRKYYKRQERKRRRQCPDQRPAWTDRPGRHGPGSGIPDYGEPPF